MRNSGCDGGQKYEQTRDVKPASRRNGHFGQIPSRRVVPKTVGSGGWGEIHSRCLPLRLTLEQHSEFHCLPLHVDYPKRGETGYAASPHFRLRPSTGSSVPASFRYQPGAHRASSPRASKSDRFLMLLEGRVSSRAIVRFDDRQSLGGCRNEFSWTRRIPDRTAHPILRGLPLSESERDDGQNRFRDLHRSLQPLPHRVPCFEHRRLLVESSFEIGRLDFP